MSTNPSSIKDTQACKPHKVGRRPNAGFRELVGASPPMRKLYRQIEDVAPSEATVLVVGESGTGKELVARSIWQCSPRGGQPFVAVNCGGIPASLLEAQLFGHERGSFTGAYQRHAGYFEQAHGGTLFLDEITEMAPHMQAALLRTLEQRSVRRVGGDEDIAVNVRVLAATNREPEAAVRNGVLREDLLYRLAVFPIEVPPLRHREGDIALLARHFLDQFNRNEQSPKRFSSRTLGALDAYPWPGNVRELKNAVHRAHILADSELEVDLGEAPLTASTRLEGDSLTIALGTSLADAQRDLILATLAHFRGDKEAAAAALGVCLKTLYNRLHVYESGALASQSD